jgi:signal transduction histidine kinase
MTLRLAQWVTPRVAAALAVGLAFSVTILGWFGYRVLREWQQSATLLVERRAQEAADLLATALTRDMRAVQTSILSSQDWDEFMLDPPYDVSQLVASAFARYPYPESFFAWRRSGSPGSVVFLNRSDRLPFWTSPREGQDPFPVAVVHEPAVAARLLDRVAKDARQEHRYSVFDLPIGDHRYQIVARLQYADPYRRQLSTVFGFMVNLDWAKQHYFPDMAGEIERITRENARVALSIVDAATGEQAKATFGRRPFSLMFFDPLSLPLSTTADLARETLVAQAVVTDDTLRAATLGARRTLALTAIAGIVFALGLALTVGVVRANADLTRRRSDFVSSVTHDLKTPVATIRAAGETLVSGRLHDPDTSREYAQLVVEQAKRLSRLLDNLLAYARITDITEAYSFEPIALESIVDEVLRDFRWQIASAGFQVDVDMPAELPAVRVDRTAIGLLLNNLVDNAVRYSKDTRSLRIQASQENGSVVLEVSDKGIGIPQDEIAWVTRKFYRGRRSPSGGSGLGLAIAERIAVDHGGSLSIRSEVDGGTTVRVTLPADRSGS